MEERLWDLANLVVGFLAVQTMAFSFVALNYLKEPVRLPELLIKFELRGKVVKGVLLGALFYFTAVIACLCLAMTVMQDKWASVSTAWYWVTVGRVGLIIGFEALTLFIIYSPVKLEKSPHSPFSKGKAKNQRKKNQRGQTRKKPKGSDSIEIIKS